jgi:hypothetical protein
VNLEECLFKPGDAGENQDVSYQLANEFPCPRWAVGTQVEPPRFAKAIYKPLSRAKRTELWSQTFAQRPQADLDRRYCLDCNSGASKLDFRAL